ncbi:MAG: hypothetical protein HC837_16075 [Chloroflexaceae bacterium]|nr:hypothetical protein [Chloroflexaceae bacterium]
MLIHYGDEAFRQLCLRLAHASRGPLIITYAPYNRLLAAMHWVGGHFPQSQRRTDIQMASESLVHNVLDEASRQITRSVRISCGFYHVQLIEALPR